METLQFNGKLKRYFQAPLYMIFVFLAGDIGLLFYNIRIGAEMCIRDSATTARNAGSFLTRNI